MTTYPISEDPAVQADGSVRIAAQKLPFSVYASPAARQLFTRELHAGAAPKGASLAELQTFYNRFNDDLLIRVRAHYQAEVTSDLIGGVDVLRVRPQSMQPNGPLLINLHGGAFAWGSGSGALVESIPMACRMGVEVIAVDYRMAPEHRFPAATEDVTAVYSMLLQQHDAEAIGIFGCSAGAILAMQALAHLRESALPLPGAVALLCAAALEPEGDSGWLGPGQCGEPLLAADAHGSPVPLKLGDLPYLIAVKSGDIRAYPSLSPALLAGFPPSLLISGNRDFAASSLTWLHRRLLAAGVDARLVQFDGLWHAFHIYPELPESIEAHDLLARFFKEKLANAII